MPGSWEVADSNRVLVAILHTETTTVEWGFGIRRLKVPGREELRLWEPILPLAGMPFDHARNTACHAMLQRGAEWLFFLDSDVVAPNDTIPRLIAHNKPLISGIYHRRSPPKSVPVCQRNGTWAPIRPNTGMHEVDVVGAGCLLVHRTVIERLPPQRPQAGKHWYDWRVDMQGIPNLPPGYCMSEDFTFCIAVRQQLGIPTIVDSSIQCRHLGYAESGYGTFEPLHTGPSL